MTAMTTDIAVLIEALDAGDDTVLSILADAMEEAGDGRCAGVRQIAKFTHSHTGPAYVRGRKQPWCWMRDSSLNRYRRVFRIDHRVSSDLYDALAALPGAVKIKVGKEHRVCYLTRSAAYLAFAVALMEK